MSKTYIKIYFTQKETRVKSHSNSLAITESEKKKNTATFSHALDLQKSKEWHRVVEDEKQQKLLNTDLGRVNWNNYGIPSKA